MRVRDLGPLALAVNAAERPVGGSRVPAILALLAININQRVSADALMDAAWGERITSGAASTLLSHVWRLRQLLEPTRGNRQAPNVLISDEGGYRLIGSAQSLDSLAFVQLAGEVGDLLVGGRALDAVNRADDALALWRGRPYGAFADRDWAVPAVARLDEVRAQVLERRVAALLAAGEVDRVLADVEPLLAASPFRERLWGVRMLALYRSGRAPEALSAYQRVRGLLVEQVGTEPGVELQQLHRRILDNDPELVPRPETVLMSKSPVEVHLPRPLTDLIGRDDDWRALTRLVRECRLVSVVGPAGCGKTRLAIDVARDLATWFPDGVWFVDLAAVDDPDLVVDVAISTIGFAPSPGATPLEELRAYLRARRVLLILDNCEHVLAGAAELVEVVLGGAAEGVGCALLATSREPLGMAGETIWSIRPLGLPDTHAADTHAADTQTADTADASARPAPAVELFLQRLRDGVPTLEVDDAVLARAAEISVAVDGLPLALELAAARARTYTLDEVAAQVTADPSRLARVGRGPADHRATISSAIEWSHRMLTTAEQSVHRRLSVLPGAFTSEVAAAVAGTSTDTDDLLAQLVHRSMLTSNGARRRGGPTMFGQLATVRAHAHHALVAAGEDDATTQRRDDWTAALVADRPPLGAAAEVGWLDRVDDCYASVRATLAELLIERPDPRGAALAARLGFFWYYRGRMLEGGRWLELAHRVAGAGAPTDVVVTSAARAALLAAQGRTDLARPHLGAALPAVASVPADRLVEVGESLVGLAIAMWVRDEADHVVRVHAQLAAIAARADDPDLALVADAVGCVAAYSARAVDTAIAAANEVYARGVARDNLLARWVASGPPMIAALLARDPQVGIPWAIRVLENHLPLGSGAAGSFIETRANFAVQAGEFAQAARLYSVAHRYTRRAAMVWPRRPLTGELIEHVREHLRADEFARAWQEGEQLSAQDVARAG